MCKDKNRMQIDNGHTVLGIEIGSTRIKSVLIGESYEVLASGNYEWQSSIEDGIWTYGLDEIWTGIQSSFQMLSNDVSEKYNTELSKAAAMGISSMMHGYMPFDKSGKLLVPFRTWRNNITEDASDKLTELFGYNIPQRWTIAHLYQAILNKEEHVRDIDCVMTLEAYIHWQLTGEKVVGIGEASGMFPIDIQTKQYNAEMVKQFNCLIDTYKFNWKFPEIFPRIMVAGQQAGRLTDQGARLLDPTGKLKSGIPMCPPEGDAGTGMVATNSVALRTGNISAGTSAFAMIVLEKELSKPYREIDMVTTPTGNLVAMAHSNNCTSDLNAWINLFREFSEYLGKEISITDIYKILFEKALEGDADCGGLLSYCYLSGEHMTGFSKGIPVFVRSPESRFNLANFMRNNLYTCFGAMRLGIDLLIKKENVKVDRLLAHGGLFKTERVGQQILVDAVNLPVTVMKQAGEGGAWGIALLAAYMIDRKSDQTLEEFLDKEVFSKENGIVLKPNPGGIAGFNKYMRRYLDGLCIEEAAVDAKLWE